MSRIRQNQDPEPPIGCELSLPAALRYRAPEVLCSWTDYEKVGPLPSSLLECFRRLRKLLTTKLLWTMSLFGYSPACAVCSFRSG